MLCNFSYINKMEARMGLFPTVCVYACVCVRVRVCVWRGEGRRICWMQIWRAQWFDVGNILCFPPYLSKYYYIHYVSCGFWM